MNASAPAMHKTKVTVCLKPRKSLIGVALVILACWYAGSSQSNGAATLLGAIIVGTALVSAIFARKNVESLQAEVQRFDDVFAQSQGFVTVRLCGATKSRCLGLFARAELPHATDVEPESARSIEERLLHLPWRPERRGLHHITHVRVGSVFPFGWFIAETRLPVRSSTLVYPHPHGTHPLPTEGTSQGEASTSRGDLGTNDFFGHKLYRHGEAQRRIDWKATARGEQILLKRFADTESSRVRLTFRSAPGADTEAKLSQLCQWVLDAEKAGMTYALELPNGSINYGRGSHHLRECLRKLAEFSA